MKVGDIKTQKNGKCEKISVFCYFLSSIQSIFYQCSSPFCWCFFCVCVVGFFFNSLSTALLAN